MRHASLVGLQPFSRHGPRTMKSDGLRLSTTQSHGAVATQTIDGLSGRRITSGVCGMRGLHTEFKGTSRGRGRGATSDTRRSEAESNECGMQVG